MADAGLYVFNGIDPDTGQTLLPPLSAADVGRLARGEKWNRDHLLEMRSRASENDKHFGVKYGVDPRDLAQSGWGVIFAPGSDAIRDALKPLLTLRQAQAGPRYRDYSGPNAVPSGMTSLDFLSNQGAGPGPADPDVVPYYLMIVAGPSEIPYEFQYQLDVQYAVGRVHFNQLEDYAHYARSVVAAESAAPARARRLTFFGTANPNDVSTQMSAEQLVKPLAGNLTEKRKDWTIENPGPEQATKSSLAGCLQSGPGALLFTASHGLGCAADSPKVTDWNGALLCQDWPGEGPATPDHFFSGEDIPKQSDLTGLISLHYACYSAGTPEADGVQDTTAQPFVARLPQRMLAHANGGALAVIGHIDRAYACSFRWDGADRAQVNVFQSPLQQLMDGYPVGAAMEFFNMRYAELATQLTALLGRKGMKTDDRMLAGWWLAHNDARNFVVIGDPAVRLKV